MSLVETSLNNVSTAQVGSAIEFDTPKANISMQVVFSGTAPGTGPYTNVVLETSLDGVTFIPGTAVQFTSTPNPAVILSQQGPVLFARANLTFVDGGTSGVTAILAAA